MKTEHKFKIGSIYRNGHGALLRLEESGVAGEALLVFASNGVALRHRARLSDGRNLPLDDRYLGLDLLPGELDAQGNPINEQPALTATEILLRQQATNSYMEALRRDWIGQQERAFRAEVEATRRQMLYAPPWKPASRVFEMDFAGVGESKALTRVNVGTTKPATVERKREPLDWNKPTPFDPFKGMEFEVRRGGYMREEDAMYAPQGPLQKLSDLDAPAHGSAALIKG